MKKQGTIRQTVSNNLYIMKFAWHLSHKRILFAGVYYGLDRFEYLFFSGYFIKKILSLIEGGASFLEVLQFLGFTAGLFLFVVLFNSWYENLLVPTTDVELYQGLHHILYEKAGNADLSCFEDSDFYNRYMMAMTDSDQRLISAISNFWQILLGAAAVAVSWFMMFRIDHMVIVFVLAPLIGNFMFAESLNKLSYRVYEESVIFRRIADYVNRVLHLADYMKELRMTNIYHVMEKKQKEAEKGITSTMDSYARKKILLGWGYLYFTFVIIFEGVIFYGAYKTIVAKTMPLSDFAVLTTLMTSVSWILIEYTKALLESMKNSLYIQNLRDFLAFEPAIPEDSGGVFPTQPIQNIEFRQVSFTYPSGKTALKDISFTLHAGESCALVGYNGAGKTTLIKLLLRFYDPTEGTVLVNGIDIRTYNLRAYRSLFSAAFQDGKIFAKSIRDNITMGQASENESLIHNALSKADILSTIESLSDSTDTILTREFSKNGVVLSGGQIQKVVAARAFYQAAPIAVFDEPSSALDPIAEHTLMENIKKDGAEKILLLISHRLSSIQDMEKIIVLKNGHISEQGTHAALMAQDGEYAALYRMQAEKYRTENAFRNPLDFVRQGGLES